MVKAYKLSFTLDIYGSKFEKSPTLVETNCYDRLPIRKKFGDRLAFGIDCSMGYAWIKAEVWHREDFSDTDIEDYLADFREFIYQLTSDIDRTVSLEAKVYRH